MNTTNVFKNLSMILATTEGGLLGVGNKLPWNCKEDLTHFIYHCKGDKTVPQTAHLS